MTPTASDVDEPPVGLAAFHPDNFPFSMLLSSLFLWWFLILGGSIGLGFFLVGLVLVAGFL
jgi:hypothetical protein